MRMSDTIANLAKAINSVQSSLHGAKKNSENPFFKSSYADLESVWASIRADLTKAGLSVVQTMGVAATGQPTLITTLLHISGEWMSGEQLITPEKAGSQAMGSAITYARRYGLAAIVGQIESDDDAEASMEREIGLNESRSAPSYPAHANVATNHLSQVTEPQLKRLFAIQKKNNVPDTTVREWIKECGVESSKQLNRIQYDAVVRKVEQYKAN